VRFASVVESAEGVGGRVGDTAQGDAVASLASRIGLPGLRWSRLGERPSSLFFVSLTRSVPGLASAWWLLLVLRSLVPAGLAVAEHRGTYAELYSIQAESYA
jgi:hypothetical protein